MRHICMFSGGASSWAAAKRVVAAHGTADVTLLFADTLIEDPDLYRFLDEASANIGAPLVRIAEGRTPWQVFHDHLFLGNNQFDLCSRILKREMFDRWIKANCDPADTIIYVGIDWTEEHRFTRLASRMFPPWMYDAPLCRPPLIDKIEILGELRRQGIEPPRLYKMGFSHNNCGGGCVKAGVGHFARLYRQLPDVYNYWERNEEAMRAKLGPTISILKSQAGGVRTPLSLAELRERVDQGGDVDMFEIGGCGCAIDFPDEERTR